MSDAPGPVPARRELPCHVWLVEEVTTSVRDPEPGVLVEWRRGPKGWEGLVLHGWHGGARLRWVLAAELRPGLPAPQQTQQGAPTRP